MVREVEIDSYSSPLSIFGPRLEISSEIDQCIGRVPVKYFSISMEIPCVSRAHVLHVSENTGGKELRLIEITRCEGSRQPLERPWAVEHCISKLISFPEIIFFYPIYLLFFVLVVVLFSFWSVVCRFFFFFFTVANEQKRRRRKLRGTATRPPWRIRAFARKSLTGTTEIPSNIASRWEFHCNNDYNAERGEINRADDNRDIVRYHAHYHVKEKKKLCSLCRYHGRERAKKMQ